MKNKVGVVFLILGIVLVGGFLGKQVYIPLASELVWSSGILPEPYQMYLKTEKCVSLRQGSEGFELPESLLTPLGKVYFGLLDTAWFGRSVRTSHPAGKRNNVYLVVAKVVRGHAMDAPVGDLYVYACTRDSRPPEYVAIKTAKERVTFFFKGGDLFALSSDVVAPGCKLPPAYVKGMAFLDCKHGSKQDLDNEEYFRRESSARVSLVEIDGDIWPAWPSLIPSRNSW